MVGFLHRRRLFAQQVIGPMAKECRDAGFETASYHSERFRAEGFLDVRPVHPSTDRAMPGHVSDYHAGTALWGSTRATLIIVPLRSRGTRISAIRRVSGCRWQQRGLPGISCLAKPGRAVTPSRITISAGFHGTRASHGPWQPV
jgi:hypothetical protein